MRRIGMFSKRIYSQEEHDHFAEPECCVVIPECCQTEKDILEYVDLLKLGKDCAGCLGCPVAKDGEFITV